MANKNPNIYGQTPSAVTAPGGVGTLGGSTYEGSFGNATASIPGIGGALNSLLTSLYGSKPATENPVSSSAQAIKGNTQNLGANSNLTLGTDTITAAGAELPFNLNLPGYQDMLSTATGNTQEQLQGEVPQDVVNQISQQAAERGIATGEAPGSPNANASFLQNLGLTSQNETATGQSNLNNLIAETPTGQSFNPSSMFVTPAAQQSADQYSNTIAAAPDPQASGLLNTVMGFL